MERSNLSPAPAGSFGVVRNPPNPARLFQSLRDSGYSNDAAIADFVDNSVDADSTAIQIHIEPASGRLVPETARIIVADDGIGMSADALLEALKLGTDSEHDLASDLGKYGMGLITAAISMGRRLLVLTKPGDGKLLRGLHDLDLIVERNEFLTEVSYATKEDDATWRKYAVNPDHGTVVIVELCDKLAYTNSSSFATHLKKHLGQVFRLFIAAKSRAGDTFDSYISVNGDPVFAVDPLMLEENKQFIFPKTRTLIQDHFAELIDEFPIELPTDPNNPDGSKESVRVRVVSLPDLGQALSKDLEINAANCGIYVMRNQREIAAAQSLNLFQRVQALNGFRAELHVPAALDRRIGLNWTKHRIEPDEGIRDALKRRIGPHVATLRKRYQKRTGEATSMDHKAYETLISKKAKLLSLPPAPRIRRQRTGASKGTVAPKHSGITRGGDGQLSDRFRNRCEFREAHMTASGPLWEPDMEGTKIIVTFNKDHPLWVRFVIEGEAADDADQNSVIELLHLFSFCLATAEFKTFEKEDEYERLVNMRQQLSNNMRVLLT